MMGGMTSQERAERKTERAASKARVVAHHADTLAVVAANRCPDCGSAVHFNSALTGWVVCDRAGKGCIWQGFTE
jgi:hypothetical protein